MKIYRFRNCYLNLTERRVLQNGNYLELTTKTFDVLRLLVEKCGEVVTKDEILGEVWNGSFVEEGNLAVHISKLRRLLDSSKTEPFIETVQGSGYRFVASVETVSDDEWHKHLSAESHLHTDKTSEEFTFDSIAVLPMENESNDPEIEYLADGLTESFINSLSRLSNLKVIARNTVFRYKNKTANAKEVGETLGVATVLTGRIRVVKDQLIISVELLKVANDTQLWGTRFNQPFANIIKIQDEITSAVSEKLSSEINRIAVNPPTNPISNNAESYRLYLKGKYLLDKRIEESIDKAIKCFQASISHDPLNVHSYIEMIECYFTLYFSDYIAYNDALDKINPILLVVSKLNQNIDVVQAMYGGKKMYLDWKFEEAEIHFQAALALNPNCLVARHRYPLLLLIIGKFSEALQILQPIMSIDPSSVLSYKRASRFFYRIERFENALTYLNRALELEPNDYETLTILGSVFAELSNYDQALVVLLKSFNIQFNIETLSMIGYVNAREKEKNKALKIIKQIESRSTGNSPHSIKIARIYAALKEKELAYKFLEKAYNEHDVDLLGLKSDPRWNSISNEPKFKELVIKVGLPID